MRPFAGPLVLAVALFWTAAVGAEIISPIFNKPFTASIDGDRFEGVVGEPTTLLVRLDPETPPPGYYVSTLVDVIQKPEGAKPKVVTGFPTTKMTFAEPGIYTLEIRVTLITKSSCGGVDAEEILRKEVAFQISSLDSSL